MIGFIGNIFDTLGKVTSNTAYKYGPAGPNTALVALAGVYLVVVEAVRNKKMISLVEFIALVLSLIGSLVLVIPDKFERLFCGWRAKKAHVELEDAGDLDSNADKDKLIEKPE